MGELTIRTRKAGAGLAWVRAGLRLFARRPVVLVVMVAFGFLVTWTVSMLPLAGTGLALVLVPATSLGMLAVCRAVEQDAAPSLANYAEALRDPFARLQLLKMGVVYAIVIGLVGTAWSLVPEGVPDPAQALGGAAGAPGAAATPPVNITPARALLALGALLVIIPLEMSLWFAPALGAWHAMRAGKALFFSFFACWRNRAALLVYVLALSGIVFLGAMAFASLIALLNINEGVAIYVLAPLPLTLLAISKTCALAMYRDLVSETDTGSVVSP